MELDPKTAGAYVNLGTIYFNARKWLEAEGYYKKALETDQACGALIADLKRRGLLQDTLVVWTGEFGRTPMSQVDKGAPGRDHQVAVRGDFEEMKPGARSISGTCSVAEHADAQFVIAGRSFWQSVRSN